MTQKGSHTLHKAVEREHLRSTVDLTRMEKEIQQLVEMGATRAQAKAALKQHNDVMEAAEKIFEGRFDHITDDAPEDIPVQTTSQSRRSGRIATPEDDEEMDNNDSDVDEGDEDDDDVMDYDSDFEITVEATTKADVDPYAGIFFSKERREEVIEVEEDAEFEVLPDHDLPVRLMTQGHWMKGCPEGGEQSFLFALYSQLSEGECPCPHGCGLSVARKKSDFFGIFPEFSLYIEHLSSVIRRTCKRCRAKFCFACEEPISADKAKRPGAAPDDNPLFHCSNIQGVILGVGLSMVEQLFTDQGPGTQERTDSRVSKRRRTSTKGGREYDDEDDLYYTGISGKKAKGGVGYAGDQREDHSGQAEAFAAQQLKDKQIGDLLADVRVYLPSLRRPGGGQTSDYLVHPTALAHLRRRFNYVCSTLLRNDSLADMSERSVLYFELLEWLETVSNHEALASMMAMPIMAFASVKSLATKKSKSGVHIRERTIVYEGSASPRELLEGLAIQARAAIKGLEGTKIAVEEPEELTEEQKRMVADPKGKTKEASAPMSEENQKLLDFCRRILGTIAAIDRSLRETKGDVFLDRLLQSLPSTSSPSNHEVRVPSSRTEENLRKTYIEWATRTRFEYCDLTIAPSADKDDQTPHYKFYFNNEARMLANSDIPKRSLAIAKELAILSTNLPVAWDSSVFLRVDETRVDVIKALITGPEGTPYHNGCYLFDIFLGPSYNQSPPSVKYMTTNGGKYRFNPNLYADGKVCLSLLGTWSGPGWVPGRSTLLQVLISIQSMILCEEPYLNEPGWASGAGTPQSQAYSANVRRMVVKTAMLGNLKNPPEPFGSIIQTHFRLKASSILKQLDEWLARDDGKATTSDGGGYVPGTKVESSSSNGFKKDVNELKELLMKL